MTYSDLKCFPPEDMDEKQAVWLPRCPMVVECADWQGLGLAMIVDTSNHDAVYADEWCDSPASGQEWVDEFDWDRLREELA